MERPRSQRTSQRERDGGRRWGGGGDDIESRPPTPPSFTYFHPRASGPTASCRFGRDGEKRKRGRRGESR
jgi:hypothetical protein